MKEVLSLQVPSSPSRPRLIAIVVTYNRLLALQMTVERLLATPASYLEAVVVVDNASDDATREWLASQTDPRIVIETLATNLGGAGGFEHGMRVATDRFDPDWLCLMDDDARPYAGAIEVFLDTDRPEEAYAAAVYFPNGNICEMNRPGLNPFWHRDVFWRTVSATLQGKGRFGFHISDSTYDTDAAPVVVDNASFVGFFVSRAGVKRVGFPDGKLFIYGDDVIYSLLLRKAGGKILFDPRVRFEHACATFATDGYSVLRPIWKVYYIYRNALAMYHLASGWKFWFVLPLVLSKWALKGGRYGSERRLYFKMLYHAILDGLLAPKERSHDEVLELSRSND